MNRTTMNHYSLEKCLYLQEVRVRKEAIYHLLA